jgi:uncharacterized protein (DUF2235 family)
MGKNIIFCADGTWNNPLEDRRENQTSDSTNIYKLFICLAGELTMETLRSADEQEKVLGRR